MYTASPQCFLGWRQVAPKMRYALEAARHQCRAPLHTMHPSRGDRRRLPKKMRYRCLERYPFMSSSSRLRSLRSLRAVKARYAIATAAIAATITSTGAKMSRAAMTDTIPSDTNRAQDTPCAPYSAACVPQGARIACRGPHALRCEPKTGRRTRGARATHRKPDTAQGARAPRAPVRAPNKRARSPRAAIHAPHEGHTCRVPRPARMQGTRAGSAPLRGTRAATRTPRRNKHTLSRILRVQHSRLRRTIHRATQTTKRWRADVRARTRISPMQAGTMVRHVSFSSEGAP